MDEIDEEQSKFSHGSVGIYTMVLRKKENPKYWKNLIKENSNAPTYMKYWFEIRDKFIDELQPYIDDIEREVNTIKLYLNKISRKTKIC